MLPTFIRDQQFGAMKMALLSGNSMLVAGGYRRSHLTTVDVSVLSRGDPTPDSPSRHHLPFDKFTVLSKVEGLTALRKAEGRRCLRSLLSFDLEALDRLAALLLHTPQSSLLGALHLISSW
jgi:hypothetical protein